jgi:hypothetical protein
MKTQLVLPQISINGTSRETLVDDLIQILHHIDAATRAMARSMPNGRDYQHHHRSLAAAVTAWMERIETLENLHSEIENYTTAIQNGG